MEDEKNLKLLSKNDDTAFEWLVNFYEKRIFGFIYNMIHNRDTAEELTQDTFVKIYENLYKYNSKRPIKPWIFKIAYNITLNYIKKNKKSMFLKEVSHTDMFQEEINNIEIKDILIRELDDIKPDSRMIVILKIMEDLTFEQIASMIGISVSSTKLKFYRSKKFLIKKIGKYYK